MKTNTNLAQCDVVPGKSFVKLKNSGPYLIIADPSPLWITEGSMVFFQPCKERSIKKMEWCWHFPFKFKYFLLFTPIYDSKLSSLFNHNAKNLLRKGGTGEITEIESCWVRQDYWELKPSLWTHEHLGDTSQVSADSFYPPSLHPKSWRKQS